MTRNIRETLVLCDMDGTLLTDDQKILRCDIEMIRLYHKLGGRFTVASGRTPHAISIYKELLPFLEPAITTGGCTIYDFASKQFAINEFLPHKIALKAIQDILRVFPKLGAVIMGGDGKTYLYEPSNESIALFFEEKSVYFVRPLDDLPSQWNKVLLAGTTLMLQEVEKYVEHRVYPGTQFVMTSSCYFELMPEGVTKGSAMKKLCGLLSVDPQNTVAIGDYYNDMDIMKQAGYSVAMKGAPVEVKMLADEVTGSNAEGGVGQYLYKLIKECGG